MTRLFSLFRHKSYLLRKELLGVWNRTVAFFRKPKLLKKEINVSEDIPGVGSKIIWSTLITSKRQDELEIAYSNLKSLGPVLAWSSLAIDGTAYDLRAFMKKDYKGGFDNLLWLTQPRVVSRRGYYAGKMGHFNRISLNFLRGWVCNLDQGEEGSAYLFCHTDGDWKIAIRPESIEPLCRFFHERPFVTAISRPLDRGLTKEPNMWPDKEADKAIWYGTGVLSTNVIIAPIERIRPLILEALNIFPRHRADLLEKVLGKLVSRKEIAVAYPKLEYFREKFFIDLVETRKPYTVKGIS